MLASIYCKEVNSWNLFTVQQPRESDVEYEEDDISNAEDENTETTPDLEDDVFCEEEEETKEIHALTEFF